MPKPVVGISVLLLFAVLLLTPAVAIHAQSASDGNDVPKSAQQRLQTLITYTCEDKPIDQVLLDLAELAKIDIVKSPKVTGNVTAKLTNVPLREALTNILAANDYTYVATDNMIRVVPISEVTLAKEQLVHKVYKVTYADVNQVTAALKNFVSDKGKVACNKGTGHIVVTDLEERIRAIDQFIAELDYQTSQVLVEVRIYDITSKEGFELGTQWRAARNVPLKTTEHTQNITNSDSPSELATTETKEQTKPTKQTTTTQSMSQFGPNWKQALTEEELGSEVTTTTTVQQLEKESYDEKSKQSYTTRRRKPFVGGSYDSVEGGALTFSLLDDAVDLEVALNILRTRENAKLIANPHVLVLDNETANFQIIREIPYTEMTQTNAGRLITSTVFKPVGLKLRVTPHVARNDMLRLHVNPEFNILVSQDKNGVPTVDTREADTITLVKDGQTVAIGGLRKRQTSKYVSKIPGLGDMPLVGGLFRSESEVEEINELIVFITTRIISQPDQIKAEPNDIAKAQIPATLDANTPTQPTLSDIIVSLEKEPAPALVDPNALVREAYAHLKAGRFDQARQLLLLVTQAKSDNGTAYQYLAYCELQLRNLDAAVQNYNKAIELNANDWESHRGLGVAYALQAKTDNNPKLRAKAVDCWQRSLKINANQPNRDGLLNLITAYSK
jgi:type IV pilus assembly protein PilQ